MEKLAIAQLPVEIWIEIIEHCVAPPHFYATEPTDGNWWKFHSDILVTRAAFFESIRQTSNLCCVCRSWGSLVEGSPYLGVFYRIEKYARTIYWIRVGRPGHFKSLYPRKPLRRLELVNAPGVVPAGSARWGNGGDQWGYTRWDGGGSSWIHQHRPHLTHLILDCVDPPPPLQTSVILDSQFPVLRVLKLQATQEASTGESPFSKIARNFPSLTTLVLHYHIPPSVESREFCLPKLESLSLRWDPPSTQRHTIPCLILPRLRHADILAFNDQCFRTFFAGLQRHSPLLRSLAIRCSTDATPTITNAAHVPVVEELGLDLRQFRLMHVPLSYALKTIIIFVDSSVGNEGLHKLGLEIMEQLVRWGRLHSIGARVVCSTENQRDVFTAACRSRGFGFPVSAY